jgi:uncharacterized protein Yka (UPF0111/DUF47 family)
MSASVPRQKRDFAARDLADHDFVRRDAPRRDRRNLVTVPERRHVVETAAPDDPDFGHEPPIVPTRISTPDRSIPRIPLILLWTRMNLLPKDRAFFDLFRLQGERIVQAATILADTLSAPAPDWEAAAAALDRVESIADETTHTTHVRLTETFITPFDPEDIHRLASRLDSVVDGFDSLGQRCRIFGLGPAPAPMQRMGAGLLTGARACLEALEALGRGQDAPQALDTLHRIESQADDELRTALYDLFRSEADALMIMKHKEVYERLESASDRFKTVAHVLEQIRLKNA